MPNCTCEFCVEQREETVILAIDTPSPDVPVEDNPYNIKFRVGDAVKLNMRQYEANYKNKVNMGKVSLVNYIGGSIQVDWCVRNDMGYDKSRNFSPQYLVKMQEIGEVIEDLNIFAVDDNPILAAQMLCDKHVVKMILESYQILAIATGLSYSEKWNNHGAVKWVMKKEANAAWLWQHGYELCREYTKRFGRKHAYENKYADVLAAADWGKHTPFTQIMPKEYFKEDSVNAYRCYYLGVKSKFAQWNHCTKPPYWWVLTEPEQPATIEKTAVEV